MSAVAAFIIIYAAGLVGAAALGWFVLGPMGCAGRLGKGIAITGGYSVVVTATAIAPLVFHG